MRKFVGVVGILLVVAGLVLGAPALFIVGAVLGIGALIYGEDI